MFWRCKAIAASALACTKWHIGNGLIATFSTSHCVAEPSVLIPAVAQAETFFGFRIEGHKIGGPRIERHHERPIRATVAWRFGFKIAGEKPFRPARILDEKRSEVGFEKIPGGRLVIAGRGAKGQPILAVAAETDGPREGAATVFDLGAGSGKGRKRRCQIIITPASDG